LFECWALAQMCPVGVMCCAKFDAVVVSKIILYCQLCHGA